MDNLLNSESPLKSNPLPFWRRKIALPVPALAFIALLFVALSLWAVFRRAAEPPRPSFTIAPGKLEIRSVNPFDVSRFDKGGRAVIYTMRRVATNDQPQKEIKQ